VTDRSEVRLLLAHGASGKAESMRPWVKALAARGIEALAIDLPVGKAERAVPVYLESVRKHSRAAIGGHSYGGRVASMVAAETRVTGLVLLSYPLHRPGRTEELRTEHWPRIGCPVLLLSGESDPFARIELLRGSIPSLQDATLVTYPGVGHGLAPVLADAADRVAAFLSGL